ncbi:MAG: FAD-dependent oxidoreductase, partial [Culicoidibacterales bacterium]
MAGKKKIVIIGGVAGGATAAARLRRLSETDEIIMFERDEYISFANCGLPYYIGEVITDRQKLLVQTVEGMSQRFNLDIRNLSEVTAIDAQTKTVTVLDRRTNQTYTETFDKLIVSPGASPIWPNMPGMDLDHIFKVRNIPDTDAIYNFIAERQPKTAVVVGGGFIGIEMAEALVERGISVTVVDKSEHILRPFDYEMAAMLQNEMVAHGVTLKLETGVSAIEADAVILEDGAKVAADLVIMAIGVSPETKLAKMAGLELGETGAILVNDQLQTSHPDIYAVGDAIEVKHYITGRATKIPLAWPANRQGRLVADHINGRDIRYTGTLGTSVIKVFALTAAATGLTAELMEFQGIEYQAIHVHRGNHAGYYPGATDISIKLLFDPKTGK